MMREFRFALMIILPTLFISFSAAAQNPPSMKNDSGMDVKFSQTAYSGGLMEVQLGKLAQKNASSYKVKEFGERMIVDHSKANEELKKIAQKNNLPLPDKMLSANQDMYNEISKYTGGDFDKHYMKMMTEDHREDIKAFGDATRSAENRDVRQWAQKTLPELKQHLKLAEEIVNGMK